MPQLERGEIVVERLTGTRVMIISASADELTVRFPDGRLEDRYVFEVGQPQTLLEVLRDLLATAWPVRAVEYGPRAVPPRPQLVRQTL
jgi:hypothetical protein